MPRPPARPPTHIFLARHGETMTNREGVFCGHSETDLTDLGRRQAEALAHRLVSEPIVAVYTSGYRRAVQTAVALTAARPLPLRADPDLSEINYGEWELQKERSIARLSPFQYRLMRAEDPAWQPPGGENISIVRARAAAALRRIARAHHHQAVLVVSHGTAIHCMLAELLAVPLTHTFRFEVANCGLSILAAQAGHFRVVSLNETAHLAGLREDPTPQ